MSDPTNAETQELAEAVVDRDRRALAKAITLVESSRRDHRQQAELLLEALLPHAGKAVRLGVTGTPGVGKSTFINQFGARLATNGHRLAVLAVDPSSRTTGGSILGDKTRMPDLTGHDDIFVRPSPSRGVTGGVAATTRDAVVICEAAGFDVLIVETVGVGQSETDVAALTDLFLLLVTPGGGDDLQGIKRGILELADVVAVNKADGPLTDLAQQTAAEYRSALHLVRPKRPELPTAVVTCSAVTGNGLDDLIDLLWSTHRSMADSGELTRLRAEQAVEQLEIEFMSLLYNRTVSSDAIQKLHYELRGQVSDFAVSVSVAARRLADAVYGPTSS